MKTQVTLTIDADIKEKFQKIAKSLGSNMSTIANMYFTQVVHTGRVEYSLNHEPVEIGYASLDDLSPEGRTRFEEAGKKDMSQFLNI